MKRKYERPRTEVHEVCLHRNFLESSYITVGGSGGYDVKRHYGNWEIDWDGTSKNKEEEDEEQYNIF